MKPVNVYFSKHYFLDESYYIMDVHMIELRFQKKYYNFEKLLLEIKKLFPDRHNVNFHFNIFENFYTRRLNHKEIQAILELYADEDENIQRITQKLNILNIFDDEEEENNE